MSGFVRRFARSMGAAVWVCFLTNHAFADANREDADRAAARSAGYEGIRAYEKGNMTVAVDKLGRAFGVVKVPTLGLWYARALVKTGKLVEASERYGEVMRLEVTEGKIREQQKAQAEAADELAALQSTIPALTVNVSGASASCVVSIDGASLKRNLFGLPSPANPGTHRIVAKQGSHVLEQIVTLKEGEKKSIDFQLPPDASQAGPPATVAPTTGAGQQNIVPPPTAAAGKPRGSVQKSVGWISLGLGGAATAAGVVTGILVLSKRSDLNDSEYCQGDACLRTEHERITSYNQLRTISTASFIVGAVGIAAGTTLLLTTPKPTESKVALWLGVGSAGVEGSF